MTHSRLISLFLITLSLTAGPGLAAGDNDTGALNPLTAEIMWQLKRVGSPSLSPDGTRAALSVTHYDVEKDQGLTDIWQVSTSNGEAKRLTTHAAGDSSPAWSPDGKWIAFVAKRGEDKESQLYVLPVDGGEARRITEIPTGVMGPRWFPDSSRLAFVSRVWPELDTWEAQGERMTEREESKVTARVWDKQPIRWWDHWVDDRQAHIYSVAVEGGEVSPVTLPTGLELARRRSPFQTPADDYDIAPDGGEIAFAANIDDSGVDTNFDIFVTALSGGEARNLTKDNPGDDRRPRYSPDGRWLTYTRQTIKGFYADPRRLMLYDRRTGDTRRLVADWDRSAEGIEWAPDSKTLYGHTDDEGVRRMFRVDLRRNEVTPVTGNTNIASVTARGRHAVVVALEQTFVQPPTLVRIDPRNGNVTKLSTFNDEILAAVDFGTYESVTYEGANGDPIQMWINYPPGFDESKRWPLYLLMHGGPHGQVGNNFHWRWNAQVFSGWGYVTAWHNFHGSTGFGLAFTDSINPNRADMPYEDTIKAAAWLADKPWIDEKRMAAGGGSYGGYLASVVLGREHPFKTLIAHAAVYNLYTQYGADYGAGKRRHGEFWENPENFRIASPNWGAGDFDTPTLVIHGENDYRVPLNHGLELFNTLQNRGVPSRLIYYPNENHWVLKPQNSIHWYGAKRDWLAEYLGAGTTQADRVTAR